ncbi:hypothetical protein EDC04DRAFT_2606153 [Pisolithus marmoratus]|nr:hypothetical protein EDC04DRAFT_2606153 [Pisolithus marmoratus]
MASPTPVDQLAAQQLASSSSTHGHGHDTCIKLFSDSHQEAVNEGQWHQQMSMQKETLVLNFWLISHFRLHKKYNDANKSLGSTRVSLTAMELRENPEMKRLLDKIIDAFPWWEDLHGFWRINPSYNMVFSMANPGQDFTMEAQQYFSGEKNSTNKDPLPLVGDGWSLGNEDAVGEEDKELECDDKDLHRHDTLAFPQVAPTPSINTDDNIDPLLCLISTPAIFAGSTTSPPASIFSKATSSSVPAVSEAFSQPVLADIESPSATGILNTQSSHMLQGTSTASAKKDKGRTRDTSSKISMKLAKVSNTLMEQIQHSAEKKAVTKQMRIQVQVIGKELKAHDKHAQHEHEFRLKQADNKHELSMASEKMKQLELELRLEEARIARLEAERCFSASKEKN